MSSSLRRGAVAASVIALSTLSLGACGAGFDAQTSGVRPDNASVSVDNIKIQNVNVVTSEDGENAAVTGRIFNDGNKDETLTAVTVKGGGEVELKPAKDGKLVVPAGGSLKLGGEGNASAFVADASKITDGNAQPVSFTLSRTGSLKLDATVVPATGTFADWGPTAPASPSPSQEAPEDGQETPGGEESPSGTESPSPSDDAEASPAA